jgi:hypothetical protein
MDEDMEDLDVIATRNIKEQMEKIEFLFSKFINGELFLKRKENKI